MTSGALPNRGKRGRGFLAVLSVLTLIAAVFGFSGAQAAAQNGPIVA